MKSFHYILLLTLYQQVDSQKAATKQVNQMQNRFFEKNIHSERRTESYEARRKVQKDEKPIGLLNKDTAQVRGFLFCIVNKRHVLQ